MTSSGSDDRRLAALHAPRRNRYYAGRMLAAADLETEQDYVRGADAQLARHVLGAGVVCGLDVTAGDAGGRPGIHVSPGLALDPVGGASSLPRRVEVELPAQAQTAGEHGGAAALRGPRGRLRPVVAGRR